MSIVLSGSFTSMIMILIRGLSAIGKPLFIHLTPIDTPDGITVDEDGYIWCAWWDGWRVVRYAPDGTIDTEIPMPVQRPTSVTFGSEDLSTLFVTSAHIQLTEEERHQQPLAGNVFRIKTNIKGLPEPFYITVSIFH